MMTISAIKRLVEHREKQAGRGRPRSSATQYVRPRLECLEGRVLLTTRTWTGAAAAAPIFADNHWTNSGNWANGAPQAGDDLVFPKDTALSLSNSNNFASGTSFNSITITGSGLVAPFRAFHLGGNAITLAGASGISDKSLPLLINDYDSVDLSQITLSANLSFYNDQSLRFSITSAINLSTFTLTLNGPSDGPGSLEGAVSGSGGIVKTGIGAWTITHDNIYTGETDVQQGTLNVSANFALGDISGDTVVSAGATLSALSNNFTVAEPLVLNGSGTSLLPGAVSVVGGRMTYTGTITLDSDTTIYATALPTTPNILTISGKIITNGHSLTLTGGLDTILTGSITGGGTVNQNTPDTFSGTGTTDGPVAVNTGSLSPGVNDTSTLTTGDVTFQSGTTFHAMLGNQTSSKLAAHMVDLTNANLSADEQSDFSASQNGFTLIEATQSVQGTFNGHPEGSLVVDNSGRVYIVHYAPTRVILYPVPVASRVTYTAPTDVVYGSVLQVTADVIPSVISAAHPGTAPQDNPNYGTVSLMEGSQVLDTQPLGVGATALLSVSGMGIGAHMLTISYTGAPNYYNASSTPFTVSIDPPPTPTLRAGMMVTGTDAGVTARVKVYRPGAAPLVITPYGSFTGGVRAAVADLQHDGMKEILTAPGPGMAPEVHIYDMNGILQANWLVFATSYTGGVYLAIGDVNGDGKDDLIVGKDAGGTSKVKVFSGPSLLSAQPVPLANYVAYRQSFTGGVRVAAADMNGDGVADIITAPGPATSPAPPVKIFDGASLAKTVLGQRPMQIFALNAFDPSFTGGVYIAAGDVTGDGRADLICGMGSGGSQVNVFDGTNLQGQPVHSFPAYNQSFTGGVRVGWLENPTGSGAGAILLAPGQDSNSEYVEIQYADAAPFEYLAYPYVSVGVFIGGD